MDLKDLTGLSSVGKALAKLVDAVQSGVGAVAQPWLLKRNARAQVEVNKIKLLGQQELETLRRALPPAPSGGDEIIVVLEEPVPALTQRAHARADYQEAKRQVNVEEIVFEAHEQLKDVPDAEVSDEPLDDDWTARFFTGAQDISSDQMRKLWAKVLAGEVKRPGSFSLRCLETMRNISGREAEVFEKAAGYVTGGNQIIQGVNPGDRSRLFFAHSGLTLANMLTLEEAGLVISSGAGLAWPLAFQDASPVYFTYRDVALRVIPKPSTTWSLPVVRLTEAGKQLATIVKPNADRNYLKAIRDRLILRGYAASLHKVSRRLSKTGIQCSELEIDGDDMPPEGPEASSA